jgi:hypothetical protein
MARTSSAARTTKVTKKVAPVKKNIKKAPKTAPKVVAPVVVPAATTPVAAAPAPKKKVHRTKTIANTVAV